MIEMLCLLLLACQSPQEAESKTGAEYKQLIETQKQFLEKVFNPAYWNKIEVKDKQTDATKKFTDLSRLEQRTFVLMFSQQILEQSDKLQKKWDNIIKSNAKDSEKKELLCYSEELLNMRRKFTALYSAHIENMLTELKDEITEPEKKLLLRKAAKMEELLPKE
jgi:hypothetical protein